MTIIKREDLAVLDAFQRDKSGRSAFAEDSIDRLVKLRFLELRGGMPSITTKGLAELQRRRALERGGPRR